MIKIFMFLSSISHHVHPTTTHSMEVAQSYAEEEYSEENGDWSGTGEVDEDVIIQDEDEDNEDEGVTE